MTDRKSFLFEGNKDANRTRRYRGAELNTGIGNVTPVAAVTGHTMIGPVIRGLHRINDYSG